jgi:hypothetical protein
MEKPSGPVYCVSVLTILSIRDRGGRFLKRSSSSSSPKSVDMTTSEPLFITVPDAPTRHAERKTAGLKPTPCTIPLMTISIRYPPVGFSGPAFAVTAWRQVVRRSQDHPLRREDARWNIDVIDQFLIGGIASLTYDHIGVCGHGKARLSHFGVELSSLTGEFGTILAQDAVDDDASILQQVDGVLEPSGIHQVPGYGTG